MRSSTVSILLPLVALAVACLLPELSAGPASGTSRGIRGEVLSVDPSGENVTVRCRGGVEYQLVLGPETGAGQFRAGGPVRVRLGAGSPDAAADGR